MQRQDWLRGKFLYKMEKKTQNQGKDFRGEWTGKINPKTEKTEHKKKTQSKEIIHGEKERKEIQHT